jgi:hypothetical protein
MVYPITKFVLIYHLICSSSLFILILLDRTKLIINYEKPVYFSYRIDFFLFNS